MIRVLHLGSPQGLYGAERWILALIRHLDAATVASVVGTVVDARGQLPALLEHARTLGFETMTVDAIGKFNWAAVNKLREALLNYRIDVLHTHFYKTDIIGLLATRGTKCKLLTTPHGWSVQAGLALRAYEALDRTLFRFFDAVVPLSPQIYAELRGRAGRRLQLIENGVDIGEIDSQMHLAREAERWRSAGEFVVGYVGQLILRKGLDVLLRAFAAADLPKGRLVIVGEGDQRPALEALASTLGIFDRTEFLGYRDDRISLMRGFNAFVLPSRLEGIPRCLMEAMATRTPIVSSDIPGSRELVRHEHTGLLYAVDDVLELRHAIAKVYESPHLRDKMVVAARELVEHRYSATAMAVAYTRLYSEIVSDH